MMTRLEWFIIGVFVGLVLGDVLGATSYAEMIARLPTTTERKEGTANASDSAGND